LIGVWAVSELAGFFGFILPWGQLKFWLASVWLTKVPLVGESLASWFLGDTTREGAGLWPVFPLLLLGLDITVMHYDDWRRRSLPDIAIFVVAVGVVTIVLGLALGAVINPAASIGRDPGASSFPIMPPWPALPFFALLRAVPNKLGGVVLMFASLFVLMTWPWMRADLLRNGPTRRVWPLLCLALAGIWIGLGYLGSRPADGAVILAAQALAACYFAFFLVLPPMLGRIAGRVAA
jgi:ubiquinol-cytochrome c reductase cytochrome b subunit